jgi:zinc resistance-associated protein
MSKNKNLTIQKEESMQAKKTAKILMVMVMILTIGTVGSALAYRNWNGPGQANWDCPNDGHGWKRGGGPGQGPCDGPQNGAALRRGGGPGYGYGMENLSPEDAEKANQLRQAFFKKTETLRSDLRSKRFELRSELAKETPDLATAKNLQKELSGLEAQLDQERIEHRLEMRKVIPDTGKGFKMGYGHRTGRGGFGGCRR